MAKANEIAYIEEVVGINSAPLSEFQTYLLNKPFSNPRCHEYLTDVARAPCSRNPAVPRSRRFPGTRWRHACRWKFPQATVVPAPMPTAQRR
jgi:hypothetical protein